MKSLKTMWSREERRILKEMYASASHAEILRALPGRSASAYHNMARHMKIKREPGAKRWGGICCKCGELRTVRRAGLRFAGHCESCYQSALAGELYHSEELPAPKQAIREVNEKEMPAEIRDLIAAERHLLQIMGDRRSLHA